MTRLLYEVAVLTEGTRNRDVQWTIEPICTSSNCSIHPPHLYLDDPTTTTTLRTTEFTSNTEEEEEHGSSMFGLGQGEPEDDVVVHHPSNPTSDLLEYMISSSNFETGQSISGYSTGTTTTQSMSELFSETEVPWLKERLTVEEVSSGTSCQGSLMEWTAGTKSDCSPFYHHQKVVDPSTVPRSYDDQCPNVFLTQLGEDVQMEVDSDDDEEESKSSENESGSTEMPSAGLSFRDALLGLGRCHDDRSKNNKRRRRRVSGSNGSASRVQVEVLNRSRPQSELITNASMSLSVPEPPEGSRCDLRSDLLPADTMVRISGEEEEESVQGSRESVVVVVRSHSNGHTGDAKRGDGGNEEETSGVMSSDVGESTSGVSLDRSLTDSSPRTNIFADSDRTDSPNSPVVKAGKLKKIKKRKKLVPYFSPPPTPNHGLGPAANGPTSQESNGCHESKNGLGPGPHGASPSCGQIRIKPRPSSLQQQQLNSAEIGTGSDTNASRTTHCQPRPTAGNDSSCDQTCKDIPSSPSSISHRQAGRTSRQHDQSAGGGADKSVLLPSDSGLYTTMDTSHFGDIHNTTDESIHQPGNLATMKEEDDNTPLLQDEVVDSTDVETEATSGVCSEFEYNTKDHTSGVHDFGESAINVNKRIVLQNAPYKCDIPHEEGEFKSLHNFVSSNYAIPRELQTRSNLDSLVGITRRVVRITVRKPYAPVDSRMAEEYFVMQSAARFKDGEEANPPTDHFGTGFAFYIDENEIHIRTQCNLVSSPEEANGASVQLNILDITCKGELTVECRGNASGFHSNKHSQSSVFTCTTPKELQPYLHLFQLIPVLHNPNVFDDSCYNTDSSAECETSIVDLPENKSSANDSGTAVTNEFSLVHSIRRSHFAWQMEHSPAAQRTDTRQQANRHQNQERGKMMNYIPSPQQQQQPTSIYRTAAPAPPPSLPHTRHENLHLHYSSSDKLRNSTTPEIAALAPCYKDRQQQQHQQIGSIPRRPEDQPRKKPFIKPIGYERALKRKLEASRRRLDVQTGSADPSFVRDKLPPPEELFTAMGFPARPQTRDGGSRCCLETWPRDVFTATSSPPMMVGMPGSGPRASSPRVLQIPGLDTGFTPFTSYAADVIESSLAKPEVSLNASPFVDPSDPWDFTSLLYAQNNFRDEYIAAFKPSVLRHFDHFGKPCDHPEAKRQLFNPPPPCRSGAGMGAGVAGVEEDEDAYDYILLGLDANWTPLQDDVTMENLVADILREDNSNSNSNYSNNEIGRVTTQNNTSQPTSSSSFTSIAILISHPHGGPKVLSSGLFSSPKHIGGELHTVPSCLGSSGAPILSFSEQGHLYMTDIVHIGTTETGGGGRGGGGCKPKTVEKFGLSYFYDIDSCFSQATPV